MPKLKKKPHLRCQLKRHPVIGEA